MSGSLMDVFDALNHITSLPRASRKTLRLRLRGFEDIFHLRMGVLIRVGDCGGEVGGEGGGQGLV
ncbi:MAG: hypothetical protein K2G05_07660, partial [Duncaniella sp.]|nr:hypothetical protein [Duncaniella sp.]